MMKNKEDGASRIKFKKPNFKKGIGKLSRAVHKAAGIKKKSKKGAKDTKATKGVKDADTEVMPVVNREKDAMKKEDGASATRGQERRRKKRAFKRKYGKGEAGKAKAASALGAKNAKESMDMMVDMGSSMYGKKHGSSMYGKKHGASMDAYQDKEASMDDYSHEKKLKADGRYEAAKGKMSNARNDFDHAHALKKDAKHDAKGRHSIMKHMRGFK